MIDKIKESIAYKLRELYPGVKKVYDESIQQNLKKPSFMIQTINQEHIKILGNKSKSILSFDVIYFSDQSKEELKNDVLMVQNTLFREFDLLECMDFKIRVLNKRVESVDNDLHFFFDVRYVEEKVIQCPKINKIEDINSNLKEV